MRNRTRRLALAGLPAMALFAAAAPASAQVVVDGEDQEPAASPTAQPAPAQPRAYGLEDIVVTARKVAENLQDVPVAVTVQTGDALTQQAATEIPDVARLSPGISFTGASSNGSASNITIRGQVQTDVLATLDPSVGVYVDDFYWARAYGLNASLLDVGRVQVLRGPQGTLFGRNTTGGAVLVETNDPNYDGISGMVSGSYGRFDERVGQAVLNVPLVDGFAALRGAVVVNKRDGFMRNEVTGERLAERDTLSARLKLRVDPTPNLRLLFSAEVFDADYLDRPYELRYVAPTSPANIEAALEDNIANAALLAAPGGAATLMGIGQGLYNDYIANYTGTDTVRLGDGDPRVNLDTQTYVGSAALDTFFGQVKFVGGYRKINSDAPLDLDGSPYSIVQTRGRQNLESWSGELQITGSAFSDFLDFAAGMFVFDETGVDQSTSIALPVLTRVSSGGALTQTYYIGDVTNRSMGTYFQGTMHLTDQVSAVAGIRYSVEDKNITSYNQIRDADTGVLLNCLIATADPATCEAESKASFDGISYTMGVNYQITPDILVYGKVSKGFRSGGQNLRASGASGGAFAPFGPEIAREYELGLKSELFDRRLRFNVAGFYNEVSDIQRTTLLVGCGGSCTSTVVSNAGKARFAGGEAEATLRIAEPLTISGSVAYVDAKYLEFRDASGDRRDEVFQNVAPVTFAVAADYDDQMSFGRLRAHVDYAWQDDTPLYAYSTAPTGSALLDQVQEDIAEALTRKAGGELNGRIGVSFDEDRFEVALYGRNILDRRFYQTGLLFGAPLYTATAKRNDPATYGITATVRFGGF